MPSQASQLPPLTEVDAESPVGSKAAALVILILGALLNTLAGIRQGFGARALLVTFGWAGIPAFSKVTRRYRRNGYAPNQPTSHPAHGTLPGNNRLNPVRSPFLLKELHTMAKATARHILVSTEDKCNELKAQIEGGADFAEVAKANSSCPSSRQGGDLGSFGPGQMVKEFDTVVFSAPVNTVQGPVKTQFGYHLL
jgi:peptidyl-prolyl cis-trans isomerase C